MHPISIATKGHVVSYRAKLGDTPIQAVYMFDQVVTPLAHTQTLMINIQLVFCIWLLTSQFSCMISIAMLHSALDALCADRSMPVEPLFQATFVYLFQLLQFLSFPLLVAYAPLSEQPHIKIQPINGKLSPLPLSAVAAKGLAGLRVIRSGKPRGIFIIVISTKALLELGERCLSNHYRVGKGNIETTCIALRRYGHADSVTLLSILLSRLPSSNTKENEIQQL